MASLAKPLPVQAAHIVEFEGFATRARYKGIRNFASDSRCSTRKQHPKCADYDLQIDHDTLLPDVSIR
jgi:hypothetical protein